MSENYMFTSEFDFLLTPPARCPPKFVLGSEVGDEKLEEKKETLINVISMCV